MARRSKRDRVREISLIDDSAVPETPDSDLPETPNSAAPTQLESPPSLDPMNIESAGSSQVPTSTTNSRASGGGRICVYLRRGLHGYILEPSNECSRAIRKAFQERHDFLGFKWKNVSEVTKIFYFSEFKKNFYWDETISEKQVRKAWNKKASARYSDMLNDIKNAEEKPISWKHLHMNDGSNIGSHQMQKKFLNKIPRIENLVLLMALHLPPTLGVLQPITSMRNDLQQQHEAQKKKLVEEMQQHFSQQLQQQIDERIRLILGCQQN